MIITDTHTHLYSEVFDEDRKEVMQRAINQGVSRFFLPAIDSSYTQKMIDLQKQFPANIFLMNGLHPCSVKENYETELAHIEQLMEKYSFCAIGEIGIDLYWDKSTLAIQKDAFLRQIRLAKKYKLPIVIHCREAFDEVFEVLENEKDELLFGIFHCFSGTEEQAFRAINLNMMLGIGGVVTFKNGKIDTFLHKINLDNIVLETDSPYLAPNPYRGKRNESAYIQQVIKKLSSIYQLPEEEIAQRTTNNSIKIFGV